MVLFRRLLGDVLRSERMQRGMTLREVSAEARVSLGYISEIERGQKEASSELLASLCAAMDLPLSEVLREVSDAVALEEVSLELHSIEATPIVGTRPGHGPVVPDASAMVAYYRTHRQERLEQVRQALADGAATEADPVEGVLTRVYAEVPTEVWPAARMSIRAQLQYLGVR